MNNENNKADISLRMLLAFAILAACFLGNMCRRASASEAVAPPGSSRIDIVGDVDMAVALLTPRDIALAGDKLIVVIDSNGGLLDGARAVSAALEARRAKGLKTVCYALKAMSAAFIIFSYCDERYVAPYNKYMMHYSYIVTSRVTVDNVADIHKRLDKSKKDMEDWAHSTFGLRAPVMLQWMRDERVVSGHELCSTFPGFCHVSYIFPVLEQDK